VDSVRFQGNGAFLATVLGFLTNSRLTLDWTETTITAMSNSTVKTVDSGYPEFAVRAEVIGRFFSPPLVSSTFHDFVKKGNIMQIKGIRGFYKLNESLHRLGLFAWG